MRLIDRYLDGDLSETEAESFLDSLASDPDLETELREYERILGASPAPEGPSAGFTDRVMDRLREPGARGRWWPSLTGRSAWRWGLGWAAAAVLAFSLGRFTAGDRPVSAPVTRPVPATASSPEEAGRLRLVRLVYVPPDPGVERVAVAGTFNEWNPSRTLMRREGDLWIAQLLLPRNTYEYMFVVDDEQWVTDPLAVETRDDGFGRENAVLDLTL